MMIRIPALALTIALLGAGTAQAQSPATPPSASPSSLVVVVNKDVPVERIDPGQATQIFLRQVNNWPDGGRIQPIDLAEGNPLRAEFYSKVTGRSPGQLRAYWARQAFTGMGLPPRELATAADVSKAVQTTPGAIGYVDRRNAETGVKIVLDPER